VSEPKAEPGTVLRGSSPPPTTFVGREAEVAHLEALTRQTWLVTVMGPPGVGKTRLTRELVGRLRSNVLWCDLRGARSEAEVLDAMMRTLGVSSPGDNALGRAMKARGPFLIVLDNCEQVAAAVGQLLAGWHDQAPEMRIVATSRERFQARGETLLRLEPLSLPVDADDIASSKAVTLFVERARNLRPDFAVTKLNSADVVAIVRALDGLPLAIELAAGRLGVLSPGQLAELLSHRFDVLTDPSSMADSPTRSLREAIETSFESLSPVEQQVFAQCAVFAGSFDLRAAEAVLELPDIGASVLDALQALHDRSLITTIASSHTETEVRFGFYVSIHEYAKERMEALCDVDALLRRHARHFARWGRELVDSERDEHSIQLATRLELEETNLAQALEWAALDVAPSGSVELVATALDLSLILDELLDVRGTMDRRRRVLDTAIASVEDGKAPARLLVAALYARAYVLFHLSMPDASYEDSQRALACAEADGDEGLVCRAKVALGSWYVWQSQAAEAGKFLAEAIAIAQRLGKTELEGAALQRLGYIEQWSVGMAAARDRFTHAVSAHRRGRHQRSLGLALTELAACNRELGHLAEAREQFEEALEVLARTGSKRLIDHARSELGWLCLEIGDEHAEEHIRAGLDGARLGGSIRLEAVRLTELGVWYELQGKPQHARSVYEEGLLLHRRPGGNRRLECLTDACRARLEADDGRFDRAGAVLDRAGELLREIGDPMTVAVCDIVGGHVDLAMARVAIANEKPDDTMKHLVSAKSRMATAQSPMVEGQPPATTISIDARLFIQLLSRAIAAFEKEHPDFGPPTGPKIELRVSERCIVMPDGKGLPLRTRGALWRIVEHLAAEHERSRGTPVSARALFEVGWPGQQAQPDAANHRVYEALHTLRKMGLHELIVRTDEGYCFQANVALTVQGEADGKPSGPA